jgi:hypothetical protein
LNAGHQDTAAEDKLLGFAFDCIEFAGQVIRLSESLFDMSQTAFEEPDVAIQPQASRFIEAGLLFKGSRTTRWRG